MSRIENLIDLIRSQHSEIKSEISELQGAPEGCSRIINKYKALVDHVESELNAALNTMAPKGGRRKNTRKMKRSQKK
jgi:hypothetical protein